MCFWIPRPRLRRAPERRRSIEVPSLLVEALPNELLLVHRIVANALLQRIGLNSVVHPIAEGGDRRRLIRRGGRLGQRRRTRAIDGIRRRIDRRDVGAAAAWNSHRPISALLGGGLTGVPHHAGRAIALHNDRRTIAVHRHERDRDTISLSHGGARAAVLLFL